jgi:O-antigen/teichoic acid export membrane protein
VALVFLGVGVGGVLFAQVLSSWLGAFLGLAFLSLSLKPLFSNRPVETKIWEPHFAVPAAVSMFLYAGLTLTDVSFARHWFPSVIAGQYSAAATVGRIFQHGPFMLTAYMFPKAAYMHTRKEDVRHLLKKTLTLTHWIVGFSLLICLGLNQLIVTLLFGAEFAASASYLPWYALAMTPMAYNWVLVNYHLAVGNYRFLYGMGAAVLVFGVGLTLFHADPFQLIAVIAASGLVLIAWNVWLLRGSKH